MCVCVRLLHRPSYTHTYSILPQQRESSDELCWHQTGCAWLLLHTTSASSHVRPPLWLRWWWWMGEISKPKPSDLSCLCWCQRWVNISHACHDFAFQELLFYKENVTNTHKIARGLKKETTVTKYGSTHRLLHEIKKTRWRILKEQFIKTSRDSETTAKLTINKK